MYVPIDRKAKTAYLCTHLHGVNVTIVGSVSRPLNASNYTLLCTISSLQFMCYL